MNSQSKHKFLKILLPTSLIIITLAVITGIFAYQYFTRALLEPWYEKQQNQIYQASQKINSTFINSLKLLGFASGELRNLLEQSYGDSSHSSQNKEQVAPMIQELFTTTPNLFQVRLLAPNGQEWVRYERSTQQQMISVPREKLQNKSNRNYFIEGHRIKSYESLFTAIDLNIENGQIERPIRPTFRAIKPIVFNGERYLAILNFNFKQSLDRIKSNSTLAFEILNSDGYWLSHQSTMKTWGHLLGKPDQNLQTIDNELWQLLKEAEPNTVIHRGNIWYSKLSFSTHPLVDFNDNNQLFLISRLSDSFVTQIQTQVFWSVFLSLLFICSVVLITVERFLALSVKREQSLAELKQEKEKLTLVNRQLKRAFDRNERMQESLIEEQKLSALGLIVAGVAHELNTPVGGIQLIVGEVKSYIHKLENQLDQPDLAIGSLAALKEGLNLIEQNVIEANDKISSFKRFAADRKHDGIREFSLNDTLNALVQALDRLFIEYDAKVSVNLESSITMCSDPGFISLVTQNLVENAIYHAYDLDKKKPIDIRVEVLDNSFVRIVVKDYGRGIAAEDKTKLFEPFYTSSRGQGHIGLGLHLVYLWVHDVLKGEIYVISEPNAGSEFIVTIPMRVEGKASPEPLNLGINENTHR